MKEFNYSVPSGGLPNQSQLLHDRAIFKDAYAVIPKGTMTDIVTSRLPHWDNTRLWVLARPLSGFAETFSQYLMEVAPGGGSNQPEPDVGAESVLFVVGGGVTLTLDREDHEMIGGGYAFIPPGAEWTIRNQTSEQCHFHWIRKAYDFAEGVEPPDAFVTHELDVEASPLPGTNGTWSNKSFVDTTDVRHDMHVNIVTMLPGASIPFAETHVMEHGLFVLQGKAVYHLNGDWVEVEAGDFMWLRAFCPQAGYAGGVEPFRYLLYKDVNRHMKL